MHLNPMGYDYLLSIPSPRAGQAFMKKLRISVIKPFGVMPFWLDWKHSEVLFLVSIPSPRAGQAFTKKLLLSVMWAFYNFVSCEHPKPAARAMHS